MSGPIFISEQAILDIHEDLLDEHGGPQGCDYGKVCSIAAYPQQKHAYERDTPDIPELAAYYGYAAGKVFHAFVDGNKRVSLALIVLFLLQNGYDFLADQDEAEETIRAAAEGAIDEEDLIAWVKDNCVPI